MRQLNWLAKWLILVWLVGFFWVEGARVWGKVSQAEEGGGEAGWELRAIEEGKLVVYGDVFSWMRFNFENYPVMAERGGESGEGE